MNLSKTVTKPWGHETWLVLNDKYCFKKLHIKKGSRTSYQYHEKKLETIYVLEGGAIVWLEADDGEIKKWGKQAGDHFTVKPGRKHRIVAITDLVLLEVSTPEVDDVIRIDDDFHRGNGRIDSEHEI